MHLPPSPLSSPSAMRTMAHLPRTSYFPPAPRSHHTHTHSYANANAHMTDYKTASSPSPRSQTSINPGQYRPSASPTILRYNHDNNNLLDTLLDRPAHHPNQTITPRRPDLSKRRSSLSLVHPPSNDAKNIEVKQRRPSLVTIVPSPVQTRGSGTGTPEKDDRRRRPSMKIELPPRIDPSFNSATTRRGSHPRKSPYPTPIVEKSFSPLPSPVQHTKDIHELQLDVEEEEMTVFGGTWHNLGLGYSLNRRNGTPWEDGQISPSSTVPTVRSGSGRDDVKTAEGVEVKMGMLAI